MNFPLRYFFLFIDEKKNHSFVQLQEIRRSVGRSKDSSGPVAMDSGWWSWGKQRETSSEACKKLVRLFFLLFFFPCLLKQHRLNPRSLGFHQEKPP